MHFQPDDFFQRLLEAERDDEDQRRKNTTTVGNYENYYTHYLTTTRLDKTPMCEDMTWDEIIAALAKYNEWWSKQEKKIEFRGMNVGLSRAAGTKEFLPYLSIRVDKELIPGHNDIYGCRILRIMQLMILQVTGRQGFRFMVEHPDKLRQLYEAD